ncbi:MAG: hypothetical protein LAO19_14910 [Acidobacteriia bacterium]|nr:hypothetical protein [Terriglobia bacterium]
MPLELDALRTRIGELNGKRRLLSEKFTKNPGNTGLALELKLIDDQIAECNVQIQLDRRKRK